jgi:hypothetical protein
MYWLLVGVLGVLILIAIVLGPHNVRAWRTRRNFQQVPASDVERVLTALKDAAAVQRDAVTFLRPMHGAACDDPTASHIGGLPFAQRGETWPLTESGPDDFLLQVKLDDPNLGEQWQGRLLQVFLVYDMEQTVRSYARPNLETYSPIQPPSDPIECVPLRHIRVPKWRDTEAGASWSEQLIEDIPAIHHILSNFGNDIEGLLSQILCPQMYGYRLTEADEAFVGGEPVLIQNPHDPVCDVCGSAMRFLFQFGEFIPGKELADGGVCYVYGCDQHPDACKAFIDSH